MKKKALKLLSILSIICLLLTGCGNQKEKEESNNKDVSVVQESPVDWKSLYLAAFKDGKIKGYEDMKIFFVDRDNDKIPELYYSYVAESSESIKSRSNKADGLSTYVGNAQIDKSGNGEFYVSSFGKGEIGDKSNEGISMSFVHLLPTDEYLWAYNSFGGSFSIKSLKEADTTYEARMDRGTDMKTGNIVYEYTGIPDPIKFAVDATSIDDSFMEQYEKAASNYVPNDTLIELEQNGTDISNWEDIYVKAITEDNILEPYSNAQIAFVDVDDNGIPNMVYCYKDSKGSIVTAVYKLTKAGYVIRAKNHNQMNYGSGYSFDMKIRYGYINKLDRNGWVLTSPAGEVLYTEDFYQQTGRTFYLNSSHPNTGMTQYDKETICELVTDDQIPEGLGEFISIDTTSFGNGFKSSFDDATSKYKPNSEIK